MELTYAKIDPKTASNDELIAEISRLEKLKNYQENEEQAIKIFINSIYGASASPYFAGFNIRIAEAITLQGQEMDKFAIKIMERYFSEFWHKDKELHAKMGILGPVEKVTRNVVVYGDTDSIYVSFEDALKSCNWTESGTDFILKLYEYRLNDYIEKSFKKYGEKYNTDNIQKLELEKVSESAIILAKKKYALDLVWKEPGVYYEPQSKISSKGVEIVQSSTPAFVRKHLKELLKMLFKEKSKLNVKKFVEELKSTKENFRLCELEDISFSRSISDYEKYILDDRKGLKIASKCPIHVRAAGVYNYKLNSSKWKRKYQLIRSGEKIRYYHTKSKSEIENIFAYQPGNFPYEFAPEIDYDMQFSKTIIEPINRFVVAMGFGRIPENLITAKRLF
jgi:DNA polymerase elongation subunit (family B)